jgi:ketosteroid isomerase-like protein
MSESRLEVLARSLDAWNRSDMDGVLAEFADDFEWDNTRSGIPGEEDVYRGHEGFLDWARRWRGTFGATQSEIVEARALPDGRLFTSIRTAGAGSSSGVLVGTDYVQVTEFAGGKVARIEVFTDEARGRVECGLDPGGGSEARRNVEIVHGVFEGIEAARAGRDPGAAFDPVADDLETVPAPEVPGSQSYRGLDGYAEFLRTWTEAFETWSHRLDRAVDAGDGRVVGWGHQWGVGKGSGVPVDLDFGIVFELRDGRLVRVRLYMEPAQALAAVGLAG